MKRLFLVGYMGCGKSTIGRRVARELDYRFVDTDAEVERREGASLVDIFQYEGEARFREIEREVIEGLLESNEPLVVSTGGGLPLWRDNMDRINSLGKTVYLRRSAQQIASRLSPYGRRKRPRLRGLSDEDLVAFMTRDMAEREPYYRQAQQTIECGESGDCEICKQIQRLLEQE